MADYSLTNTFFTTDEAPAIDVEKLDNDAQARVQNVFDAAVGVFEDLERAKKFLVRPNAKLGEPPLNAAATSPERHDRVIGILDAIAQGAPV